MTIKIAIVGFGKIAVDEHVPAIAADPRFSLAAVVTRSGDPEIGVPAFPALHDLLSTMPDEIDAISLCTPPRVRRAIAAEAITAGLAVLLEKPPAATLGELEDIEAHARTSGTCLYAAWHSQHAPAVAQVADMLRDETIVRLAIDWREDVRKWHPGQEWIWEPDGFGVFDPGINALSIASAILPERLIVEEAEFAIPANRHAPIAARLRFSGPAHNATFDWREQGGEAWTIAVDTDSGKRITLFDGGARLVVDGAEPPLASTREYPSIYARFAELVDGSQVECDQQPLRIVADASLIARRIAVEPFL
jgi:predicted dehydrogenase